MLSKRKVSRKNKKALKSALAIDEVKKSTLQEKTKIPKTQDKVKKSTLQEKTNVKISVSQDKPIVEKSTLKTQKKSTLQEKSASPRKKTKFPKTKFPVSVAQDRAIVSLDEAIDNNDYDDL